MKLVGKEILKKAQRVYSDAKTQIDAWIAETENTQWATPNDVKKRYASASFMINNQVIFNIKGNRYRLLTKIDYKNQIVLVKKFDTHNEYSNW